MLIIIFKEESEKSKNDLVSLVIGIQLYRDKKEGDLPS